MSDEERIAPAESELARLARAILDGSPVDWNAEANRAGPSSNQVEQLRILSELATLHRMVPPLDDAPASRLRITTASTEIWGGLTLLEKVGQGAFGEVYRAWDSRLAREVALKLLRPSGQGAAARGVIEEGRLLARVRHPNVVTVHGAEEIGDRIGIWTEFIDGHTLAHLVSRGGVFPTQETAAIGVDLCSALAAVHRAGLLHRDVKAQNVMRAAEGRIVLMDFGASHEEDARVRARRTGTAGTPLYLAPELWDGAAPSRQSDIYAVGVLLFYLLSGTYPVTGGTVDAIAAAHKARRYRRLGETRPGLPAEIVAAVERALAPVPAARYESAEAFAAALRPVAASTATPRLSASAGFSIVGAALVALIASLLWTARPAPNPLADSGPTARKLEFLCNEDCRPSPNGRFIPHTREGDLWTWDVSTGESRRVTRRPKTPENRGVFPASATTSDGRRIAYAWRSMDGRQMLATIDTDGAHERTLVPLQGTPRPRPIQWAADGQQLLCWLEHTDGRTELALIDRSTGGLRVLQSFRIGPFGAALSPDGRFVVYDQPAAKDSRARDLFIAGTDGTPPRAIATHPANDARPLWAAGAGGVMFWSERSGYPAQWFLRLKDGVPRGEPVLVARLPPGAEPVSVSDDGALFYWMRAGDIDVYRQQVDWSRPGASAAATRIDPTITGGHSLPAWSADGQYLSYVTQRTFADKALMVLDAATGDRREVPLRLKTHSQLMRWAPDGQCVATTGRDEYNRVGYFCLDVITGEPRALWLPEARNGQVPVSDFEWSRDGTSLVFRDGRRGIVSRRVAGGADRVLVPSGGAVSNPGRVRLSPDGSSLAFNMIVGQGKEARNTIFAQVPLGGTVREIFRATPGESIPIQGWTPDGTEVVFSRFVPSQDPAKVTYRLWAASVRDGAARDLQVSVPGLTHAHDIALSPDGRTIAYAHFTNRRFAEMWVMRNILPAAR